MKDKEKKIQQQKKAKEDQMALARARLGLAGNVVSASFIILRQPAALNRCERD